MPCLMVAIVGGCVWHNVATELPVPSRRRPDLQLLGPTSVAAIVGPPPFRLPLYMRLASLAGSLLPGGAPKPFLAAWLPAFSSEAAAADVQQNGWAWLWSGGGAFMGEPALPLGSLCLEGRGWRFFLQLPVCMTSPPNAGRLCLCVQLSLTC